MTVWPTRGPNTSEQEGRGGLTLVSRRRRGRGLNTREQEGRSFRICCTSWQPEMGGQCLRQGGTTGDINFQLFFCSILCIFLVFFVRNYKKKLCFRIKNPQKKRTMFGSIFYFFTKGR